MRYNSSMIKKIFFFSLVGVIISGCFNDRGVSLRYYNDCEEYYDAQGYYHKQCDKNVADYSDAKVLYNDVKNVIAPQSPSKELGKVW